MKFRIILVTILVTGAIETQAYTRTDRRISSLEKRQTNTNADQMVQNILEWLQGISSQNSRRVRQGSFREYLPPSNTEKPRPFQPGYPPAGISPEPPFPFPTNPATGGVTAPEGYQPGGEELLPPERGYTQPEATLSTSAPTEQPAAGGSTLPPYTTSGAPGLPTGAPTNEEQPGPFPTHPAGTPTEGGLVTTSVGYPPSTPEVPFTSQPGATPTTPGPTFPPYTSPEASSQPPQQGTTGPEQPQSIPEQTQSPTAPEGGPTYESTPGSTLAPSGFATSTPETPSEAPNAEETTASPESNTIPGPGAPEPSVVDEEDLKHPPHIHAIDVQCSKEMMTINIEFNREFNGIIYSKEHYNEPECRYVQENSGQTKYSFTVNLGKCGTTFVNAFEAENQSYLENVLVLQNEPGIQEVWDTLRSVRCLWEGNLKDTLSVAFSIGMLSQEIITFSGDTAMAKLDVVLGRGPFGEPANGLVKIGEQMTLVVSVSGDPGFDLQVKDCRATDAENKNSVALTDEDGCILKPKLFGAFQKTRETGNSGASIIAYAYFNAFKFPDEMDLMIECNIELCKTDCDICSKEGQQLEPAKRRKRDVSYNNTGDWITMGKLVKVILPEDLNKRTALELSAKDHICMTIPGFVFSTALLVSLLVITSFVSVCLWIKRREKMYLKH